MSKEEKIIMEGKITESFPNRKFKVQLPNGKFVVATLSGKMSRAHISLTHGDGVRVEISPYDLEKGRIVHRLPVQKSNEGGN